jgi:peptide/nickel transport system permease protein
LLRYIVRRVLIIIPTLWVMSLAVFLALNVLPGDAAAVFLGHSADEQARELFRQRVGLDQPLSVRYVRWLANMVRGDFGESYFTGFDIGQELASRMPLTLELAALATIISLLVGLPAGVLAAAYQGRKVGILVTLSGLAGVSMPVFWLATVLVLVVCVKLRLMPSGGYVPFGENPLANIRSILLPSLSLGLVSAAIVMRMARSSMLEVLRKDYIRTARAKGLTEWLVVNRHALKNALVPIVTVSGIEISAIFGGTVLIEQIFLLPGLGKFIWLGVTQRDYAIVQAGVLVMLLAVQVVNLLVDVTNAILDPRRRHVQI